MKDIFLRDIREIVVEVLPRCRIPCARGSFVDAASGSPGIGARVAHDGDGDSDGGRSVESVESRVSSYPTPA